MYPKSATEHAERLAKSQLGTMHSCLRYSTQATQHSHPSILETQPRVFEIGSLLEGNNPECFVFQAAQHAIPVIASGTVADIRNDIQPSSDTLLSVFLVWLSTALMKPRWLIFKAVPIARTDANHIK